MSEKMEESLNRIKQKDIFAEIHGGIPREGPGDSASTRRALSMLVDLPPAPHILDVGSGPGMQTIDIARNVDGEITALDHNREYLAEVEKRARASGVGQQIETVEGIDVLYAVPRQEF
jgi:predicted O-methyltransferase YrrM